MKEITKAILSVAEQVKSIDKGLKVGAGNSSYKAVGDSDVRNTLRKPMADAGLVLVPTGTVSKSVVERYVDNYGNNKQSVFTEVETTYKLIHQESGESLDLAGYGQGVDSQDKGAGKATTYALKNTLLDLFMITKGTDYDTDATHSDDIEVVPAKPQVDNSEPFPTIRRR